MRTKSKVRYPISLGVAGVIAISTIAGCPAMVTAPQTVEFERLSWEKAKANLVVGSTDQAGVRRAFGPPTDVVKAVDGTPVWMYGDVSFQQLEESSFVVGAIAGVGGPVAGAGGAGTSTSHKQAGSRSATMLIYFDAAGIVKGYNLDVQKR